MQGQLFTLGYRAMGLGFPVGTSEGTVWGSKGREDVHSSCGWWWAGGGGGVLSSHDWAGAWKERACEEEEGRQGGLRSKWLSAGPKLARLVPLTWLFLGF